MRKNILAAGITFLAVAILFGISSPGDLAVSVPFSIINILLGLITQAAPGVDLQPETGNVRLVIDRGVVRASIYQLVFLNSKVVLKRLSSVMITVVMALALALVGLTLLFIIGALMGGITGFSLQEYLTQRARDKIGTGARLTQLEKNDIEINYSEIRQVQLIRNRLYVTSEDNTLIARFPRGYSLRIEPSLERIFGSKFVNEESGRPVKTPQK